MKIVSSDIETTGLKPTVHGIIQFAAVAGDTEGGQLHQYHAWIKPEGMVWDLYCLRLHYFWLGNVLHRVDSKSADHISMKQPRIHDNFASVIADFTHWLDVKQLWRAGDAKLNALGKNFGSFDYQFLQANGMGHLFAQRALDPTPYYALKTDARSPDLLVCKVRATSRGCTFESADVAHTALEDALDVMTLYQFYHDSPWPCGV